MKITVIGGLNGSIMKEKGGTNDFTRYYSTHVGALVGLGGQNIMVETGIIYFSRGTQFVNRSFLFPYNVDFTNLKVNYLDIPLMVVAAPNKIRFFFGPQYSVLLSAKLEGNSADMKDSFERTCWGLRYGIGYNTKWITTQFHLVNVLSDIYRHPDIQWTNHSLQLSVGFVLSGHSRPAKDPKKQKSSDDFPEHRKID